MPPRKIAELLTLTQRVTPSLYTLYIFSLVDFKRKSDYAAQRWRMSFRARCMISRMCAKRGDARHDVLKIFLLI